MAINREIRFKTVGNNNTVSQAFYNNIYFDSKPVTAPIFAFDKPQFYTYGGTLNYYSQDPYSIFTNLVKPPIRFVFTANTGNLSGDSYFVHEIFRLDYDTYKLFSNNQIDQPQKIVNSQDINGTNGTNATNGNSDPSSPATNKQNKSSRTFQSDSNVNFGSNKIPIPQTFFGQQLSPDDFNTIQKYFTDPIIVFTASTSAVTGNIYDLFLDQYIKKVGNYKTEFFLDKAQYIINTKIVFNIDLNKNYIDFTANSQIVSISSTTVTITASTVTVTGLTNAIAVSTLPSGPGTLNPLSAITVITAITSTTNFVTTSDWNDTLQVSATNSVDHRIQSGPFTGIKLAGNFFAYFIVPDKPQLEYPIITDQLSTFTPEFRWSNGDNADSFIVQINYNTGDTGFTGTVYNYPVTKSDKNSQIVRNTLKDSTTETASDKTIYTFQVPVKSNKSFIYRVGNSKELMDIFDVRRNVITFSDYYMAISQPQPIRTHVVIESDSRYTNNVAGFTTPPSLDFESELIEYTLSGVVSGSTVTGATMQLTFPNMSFVTTTTDSGGTYSFSGLAAGIYTLTTNYRGYQQDIRAVNIVGNTSLGFKLHLLWSDAYDTWGSLAGESYYT